MNNAATHDSPAHDLRTLPALGFDPKSERWVHAIEHRPLDVGRLTLVTYNIWFGKHRRRKRLAALLKLLKTCRADVIALQEVTPRQLAPILATDWVRRDYLVSDASGVTLKPHGVLLLSRLPMTHLTFRHLPSRKHRKLLSVALETPHGSLSIGNLHLESSPANQALRLTQLGRILSTQANDRHAILMGDFNFDPQTHAEQSCIRDAYLDLWPALNGHAPGHTVDSTRNRMRFLHKRRHGRIRFDRILLRSESAGWEPRSIHLLGTEPISDSLPDIYPSDHFGLVAVIAHRRQTGVISRNLTRLRRHLSVLFRAVCLSQSK